MTEVKAEIIPTEKEMINEVFDISLGFEKGFGTGHWKTYQLWDDGISTHCNIAFKTNARIMLDIPASLSLKHPKIVEPGEQFYMDASLSLPDNRQLKFFFEFYIKIDLDLPGITTYIPGLGFVDDIKDIYGGEWEFTFDLNNQFVDQLLNKIWLGNTDKLQSFIVNEKLSEIVTIDYLTLNPQTLGTLMEGKIRVDILEAILTIGKELVLIEPFHSIIVGLDWVLDNVIETNTGFEIRPTVTTEIVTPINSGSLITTDYSTLIFNNDMSTKSISSTVNPSAQENPDYNQLELNCGPLEYRLNVNADWNYYLDLQINCLGLNLYENSWNWYLGCCPSISNQLFSVTQQISPNLKLDEPLEVGELEINDGQVKVGLNDNSGLSTVNLLYSTDKHDWQTIAMSNEGKNFLVRPINEVETATTVYYYIEVMDGDNDDYRLDNNGLYYSYSLEPPPETNFLDSITQDNNKLMMIGIVTGAFVLLLIVIVVAIRKRPKNARIKKQKGY